MLVVPACVATDLEGKLCELSVLCNDPLAFLGHWYICSPLIVNETAHKTPRHLRTLCHWTIVGYIHCHICNILRIESGKESDLFLTKAISAQSLKEGTRLLLGWQPDRICEIKYLGNNRFEVIRTENSSINPGDSFSCLLFEKGRELYLDLFQRAEENGEPNPEARYVVGQRNGLTTLEIIKD
jgi:hypothetical protein